MCQKSIMDSCIIIREIEVIWLASFEIQTMAKEAEKLTNANFLCIFSSRRAACVSSVWGLVCVVHFCQSVS